MSSDRTAASEDRIRGLALVAGMVVVMWVRRGRRRARRAPRQRRHPPARRRLAAGDRVRAVPARRLGAPDRQHDPVPDPRLHDRARRARPHGGGDGDRGARGGLRHVADRPRAHEPHRRQRRRLRLRHLPRRARHLQPPAAALRGRAASCSRSTARRWRSRSSRRRASHGRATCSARSAASSPRASSTPYASAISSSFVTVFQLRSVAATPSFARPSCLASSERPDPVA